MRSFVILASLLIAGCLDGGSNPEVPEVNGSETSDVDSGGQNATVRYSFVQAEDCRTLRIFPDLDRAKARAWVPADFEFYGEINPARADRVGGLIHIHSCAAWTMSDQSHGAATIAFAGVEVVDPVADGEFEAYTSDIFTDDEGLAAAFEALGWNVSLAQLSVSPAVGGYDFNIVAPGISWSGLYIQPAASAPESDGGLGVPIGLTWHRALEAGYAKTHTSELQRIVNGMTPNYSATSLELSGGMMAELMYESNSQVVNSMDWSADPKVQVSSARA